MRVPFYCPGRIYGQFTLTKGRETAAVHVSSVLHDSLAEVFQERGPVITPLETPRTWALDRKRPTINQLGRSAENVLFSTSDSVLSVSCSDAEVRVSTVKIDWNRRFDIETTGSSLVPRPRDSATFGFVRELGGPNSWFCNDAIGIYCDDNTGQVSIYSLNGEVVSRFDIRHLLVGSTKTLNLHPYARSFCFGGHSRVLVVHDFEKTGDVLIGKLQGHSPISTEMRSVGRLKVPVIGWSGISGFDGAIYPRSTLGENAPFLLVHPADGIVIPTSGGVETSVTLSTGFSCAANDDSIFVSDHQGSIYELDRQLRMRSQLVLGVEALVVRCGQRILAITSEMVFECSADSVQPVKPLHGLRNR